MGFDPNDDSDNDLPDWLKGMQSGEENGGFEPDDSISANSEDTIPSWLQGEEQGGFTSPQDEDEGETPEWLANIRKLEADQEEDTPQLPEEEEDENQAWLESIRQKGGSIQEPDDEEEDDFLEKIQEMKESDSPADAWDDGDEAQEDDLESPESEEDLIASAWDKDTDALSMPEEEDEEAVPDWVSGLHSLDPVEMPAAREPAQPDPGQEDEETPDWLKDIRHKTAEDTKQPEDVLPAFGFQPDEMEADESQELPLDEDEAGEDQALPADAFTEQPTDTGSLPSWLENLQTSGLVESTSEAEEIRRNTAAYVEDEDVSSLFEDADLPEWLGEEAEGEQEPEPEEVEEEQTDQADVVEEEIHKGEMPSWLQAMRPVEAVTAMGEEPEEDEVEPKTTPETVGPLSGLRDVLPAEPHIIHFGTKPRPAPGFELTQAQQNYAGLLKSLVDEESASGAAERRGVANPQQVLRWVIGIFLLTILFSVLWWNGDILSLPRPEAIPEENLAAISLVNQVSAGERVLVAFEYQPGLSGEMQAASAALLSDLVWSEAELVLVSSQPVGLGLADSFLQGQFKGSTYIAGQEYTSFGYLPGGAAGLRNFAISPRQAKPEMKWDQAPLNAVQTIRDFALVLVITDDPDVARSWVEQVQPLLDLENNGQGIPLVMVVSAQAEPLVYPYYITTPRQISGLVSGVSGGAFYEALHGTSLARRYWDAYNTGLVLAVLVVALGSVFNLTRTSLSRTGKGRS